MPTYVYEIMREGKDTGEVFEVVQGMSEPPLTKHPETGEPVRRIITAPNIVGAHTERAGNQSLSNKNLERHGFTKYERADKGQYVRTAGKEGPATLG